MSKMITVLLSVHNAETTLERTFRSLSEQTSQNFNILVIDDASTDTSQSILKRWQGIFGEERFILLSNEKNLGLTKSLNIGLDHISTPYTARIDGDDWWTPDKLEKQILFLKSNPEYGIIGCAYTNISYGNEKKVFLPKTDEALKKFMFFRNPFAHSCVIFQTELVKNSGGYDENIYYGQDYELWLRISSITKFYNLPENLCYRNAESGISHSKQNAQLWQYVRTQYTYLRKLHRPLSDYRYMIEPLLVILTPQWIRTLKRKYL